MSAHGFISSSFILVAALALTGCLQTRGEVEAQQEKQVIQTEVKTLQKSNADVNTRFNDIDDDLRKMNGRIEGVEERASNLHTVAVKMDKAMEAHRKDSNDKMDIYKDALAKLQTQVNDLSLKLTQQVAQLAEEQKKLAAAQVPAKAEKTSPKGSFATAEQHFDNKEWKEAIATYDKYLKGSPNGKNAAMANYKIGVSFQELGITDSAQTFFEGTLAQFPNSPQAKKAKIRLKSLKQK